MNGRRCLRCGAPATVRHHPTGRLDGVYFDEDFVEGLCGDCHGGEHVIRRALGLEHAGPAPATFVERVALVVRRIAVGLGRLAEAPGFGPFFDSLARVLVHLANGLDAHVAALDRAVPAWREAIT